MFLARNGFTVSLVRAEMTANHVRESSSGTDERRNRVDHRFSSRAAERFFPDRRDDEDARQREVVGRLRNGRCRHDLRVLAEVDAGQREEQQPLCGATD